MSLLPLDDALHRLLSQASQPPAVETLPLAECRQRILAADVTSPLAVPAWDNSAMDGYALATADLAVSSRLPVVQRIAAGQAAAPLAAGGAARIFTGAPIPSGADAVVMQEECAFADGQVTIQAAVRPGQNIRRCGEDIALGAQVLAAGRRLTPADLGLAASVGISDLPVYRRLRVAVFFTGDELVNPGQPLPAGKIYNSNRALLHGLLGQLGCDIIDLGNIPDQLDATRAALRRAAAESDVVITCGGVSVGEEDHVKAAVQAEGSLDLWRIAIKPGKPLALGQVGAAQFIGLPGNPVSAFVTFQVLVRPFLRQLQGAAPERAVYPLVRAGFDWPRPDKRREFLRARWLDTAMEATVALYPNQGSGVLSSVAWADGLVDVAPEQVIQRGDWVRWIPLTD